MIYLIRHATPDWSQIKIPYSQLPGPPLTAQGEAEATGLGSFLRESGVRRMYASPFERCRRTAALSAEVAGASVVEHEALTEWRPGETEADVRKRLIPFWETLEQVGQEGEILALVSHGGPIAVVLSHLGMDDKTLAHYRKLFDRNNPLPPAGVWQASRVAPEAAWDLRLVYMPEVYRKNWVV